MNTLPQGSHPNFGFYWKCRYIWSKIQQGCLRISKTYSSPLTAFPSALYSVLGFFCPLKLWLALYNFTGLCVKEFLFIVVFIITSVVRYTFAGIGDAELKEGVGSKWQSSWLLCNSSYSRTCTASSHLLSRNESKSLSHPKGGISRDALLQATAPGFV